MWDTKTTKLLKTLIGHSKAVTNVAFTHDNKYIVSASFDNTIKIWDFTSEKVVQKINTEENGFSLDSFVLTPDSKFIVGGLQNPDLREGALLKIWRASDGKTIQTLPIRQDFSGYYEELNKIAISSDGSIIISASRERMVKVWMNFPYYLYWIGLQELYS